MANIFDLENYRCEGFLDTAWRVTYPGSQTELTPANGLVAADTTRDIFSRSQLRLVVANHLNIKCQNPSCFVSVFQDKERALSWAKNRGAQDEVFITEIDMNNVPDDVYVFDAAWLAEELDTWSRGLPGELLFLYHVPQELVRETRNLRQVYQQAALPGLCFPSVIRGSRIGFHSPKRLDETTNPMTTKENPNMRYFKAPLEFSDSNSRYRLIRIPNVQIAFRKTAQGASGNDYAYASLSWELREKVLAASHQWNQLDILNPDDERLASGNGKWWKTIAFNCHTFTIDSQSSQASDLRRVPFDPRSVLKTRNGCVATLLVGIYLKAKKDIEVCSDPLGPPDSLSIEVEVYSGHVTRAGVDTGPVPYISYVHSEIAGPLDAHVASTELIERLKELGIR